MTHYLVVAHETAGRPDLARALTRVAVDDAGAVFTLLVTATASMRGLTGHTPHLERVAHEAAERARVELRDACIHLVRVLAGDGSPPIAVEDELREHPERYDAVLAQHPPAGATRLARRRRAHRDRGSVAAAGAAPARALA